MSKKAEIGLDLGGYPMNLKYPPNRELYGNTYYGYKNVNQEALFYDFAVMSYDVSFKYKDKDYYLLTTEDHAALCDEHFNEEYEAFPSENNLIENLIIDGKPLIQIIDDLIEVEVY